MTREELDLMHSDTESTIRHTDISIEYAISEIESLKNDAMMGFPFADQQRVLNWFDNRMDELRKQL